MIQLQASLVHCAPVAQLDRALASEARGRAFESPRARHLILKNQLVGVAASALFLLPSAFLGTLGNNCSSSRCTASRCAIRLALGHQDNPEKKGPRNIPLGILQLADYEHLDIELDLGDCLVIYADAFIESCDADGEMLGEEGSLRIVNLLGAIPAEKIIASLLQEIAERFSENLSADDVTVMVVRANGRSLHFSWGEKIDALGRFLKTFVRSLNPSADRARFPDANLANIGGVIIPALARRWRAPRISQK